MGDEYTSWLWKKRAEKCVKNLIKHRFDAHYVETAADARKMILGITKDLTTIGFGGSVTINSIDIKKELHARGKTLFDHNDENLSFEEKLDYRKKQVACDCFLLSANGIAETGEIVNVDGVGNRTNAMTFGPGKVIVVAGVNKLAPDLHSAIRRIKEVAAPMRAKSLGVETPCAETGICVDCNAPMRICNITAILHRKPMMTDVTVILINQELGY